MGSLSVHEVCRVQKQEFSNGCLKLREYSFLTDHTIHLRITELDTDDQPNESTGWIKAIDDDGRAILWPPDLSRLMSKVLNMEMAGWTAVWGKGYGPEPCLNDYIQTVRW